MTAALVVIAFLVVVWVILKTTDKHTNAPPPIVGNKGSYFNDPAYRYSRTQAQDVVDAAAAAEAHKSGRHTGAVTHVYANFGSEAMATDFEVVNHARWLMKYGTNNDVHLHIMDGDREMTAAERDKVLYNC